VVCDASRGHIEIEGNHWLNPHFTSSPSPWFPLQKYYVGFTRVETVLETTADPGPANPVFIDFSLENGSDAQSADHHTGV